MYAAHIKFQEVKDIVQRRRRVLILPVLLITTICTIAAFLLPRKYESSTTILIRRTELLNPLVTYEMGVNLLSDDKDKAFTDVVYSQTTIQTLIDSLDFGVDLANEADRQLLVQDIFKRISVFRTGESTVHIGFEGKDPVKIKRAVELITQKSISTMVQVENQKSAISVKFFEEKLRDYQEKYEQNKNEIMGMKQNRIAEMPVQGVTLTRHLEEVNTMLGQVDTKLQSYEDGLEILNTFPEAFKTENGLQALFMLQRNDLPYTGELNPLLTRYSELSLRYTHEYPAMIELESKILFLLKRMQKTVEAEIPVQRKIRQDHLDNRSGLIAALQKSSSADQSDYDQMSTYKLYQDLYDDMKRKLEQARTNQELNRMGEEQFVILDPPIVPSHPTKPNRVMIIISGFLIGMLVGVVAVILSEMFDVTIRTPKDLEAFQPRVLAILPTKQSITGR